MAPAGGLNRLPMADALVLLLPPSGLEKMLFGSTGATGMCAVAISDGGWHVLHRASSAIGPAGWPAPVVKSTASWHAPHALRLGRFFQLSASAAFRWHLAQLLGLCGKVISFSSAPRPT